MARKVKRYGRASVSPQRSSQRRLIKKSPKIQIGQDSGRANVSPQRSGQMVTRFIWSLHEGQLVQGQKLALPIRPSQIVLQQVDLFLFTIHPSPSRYPNLLARLHAWQLMKNLRRNQVLDRSGGEAAPSRLVIMTDRQHHPVASVSLVVVMDQARTNMVIDAFSSPAHSQPRELAPFRTTLSSAVIQPKLKGAPYQHAQVTSTTWSNVMLTRTGAGQHLGVINTPQLPPMKSVFPEETTSGFSGIGAAKDFNNVGLRSCPNTFKRSISDHCPISLSSSNANWGPRPFKSIDSWTSHHEFGKMIQSLWNSFQVEGYWGFKCKEKLKALRMHLKQWNKDVFGNIDSQLDEALKNIEAIDIKCEGEDITKDDMLKRKEGIENLWQCLKKKESLWRQKSRASWIKDEDANSRFFHRITNGRRQRNMIHGVDDKGT
ncbi:hypothetical protein SLEP1_g34865 [Rubroshorea leprosula]|uniref:Uncharacterized protein n=1 Tax=Rubroshorea leprosula TaxID=152421 RepID=A0AAV5KLE3_9ROSI|nr:hypothetical protein SLEP1_g34865 [Rubroshorea leprosula]